MDGTVTRFGGKAMDSEGYDFLGLMTGSEGLLGVITEVTVKILKSPEVVKAALIGFPINRGCRQLCCANNCTRMYSCRHGNYGQSFNKSNE